MATSRPALEQALTALGVRCAWYESRGKAYPRGLFEAHEEIRRLLKEVQS